MRINIGKGLDHITFGMSQEEVESILGKPDKTEGSADIEMEDIEYYYNKKWIKLIFDESEDYKLFQIEVFNPEVIMLEQQIITKDKSEILALLERNGYNEIEQEGEDNEIMHSVFCEEIESDFYFNEFNRLDSIIFSPLYDSDDDIIWP